VTRYAIPPHPVEDLRQWRAGLARGEQQRDDSFFRRAVVKGLLQGCGARAARRRGPHSEAMYDAIIDELKKIVDKLGDSDSSVKRALAVARNTVINDIKVIRREEKRTNDSRT
jgi:hypothetical protein